MNINIPISVGELLDKLSILEIKQEKIDDTKKLKNINFEYDVLKELSREIKNKDEETFESLYTQLLEVNNKLWEIEDSIRVLEVEKRFDKDFISLARSVYFTNDERFKIKNEINKFYNSGVIEEKEYIEYDSN